MPLVLQSYRILVGFDRMGKFKYKAFISYSHLDESAVSGLHAGLERYRIPKTLVKTLALTSNQLRPIFRDRDELSAGADLTASLQEALDNSEFLIVACSRAATESIYLDLEIRHFKRGGRSNQVLAVIVDGEKNEDLFPQALLHEVTSEGELGERVGEPLAADLRPFGDGQQAIPKLIASVLGVQYDDLVRRHTKERRRKLQLVAAATTTGMLLTGALAFYALEQRTMAEAQRDIAELETKRGQTVVAFLIDTFRVSDPATENPREVTALQILERGRKRLDDDLIEQPKVRATLLTTISKVYQNLGLHDEAVEAVTLALVIDQSTSLVDVDRRLTLARSELQRDEFEKAKSNLTAAEEQLTEIGDTSGAVLSLEAHIHSIYGFYWLRFGDYERAKENLIHGIELLDEVFGPKHRQTIAARGILGTIYLEFEEYEQAEPLLVSALENAEQLLGTTHSRTNNYRTTVARVLLETGRGDQAIELLGESIRQLEAVTGQIFPQVANAYMHLGRAYEEVGKSDDAQKAFDTALEIGESLYGLNHGFNGVVRIFASRTATSTGASERAFQLLDKAESILKQLFSEDHVLFGLLAAYQGFAFGASGKVAEAKASCNHAMAILGDSAHKEAELCAPWLDADASTPGN